MMNIKISKLINNSLNRMYIREKKLLNLSSAMLNAYGGALYPVDLLAIGIIKRTLSCINGFQILVESQNMICARTLLRTQIDSALRFYAVFIVDKPHDFSIKVLKGEQINRIKDSSGNNLRDAYLVEKLSGDYPWLKDVYHNLSGYVHFSNSHIFSAFFYSKIDKNRFDIEIKSVDENYPASSWVEVVDCFNNCVDIFIKYLEGWVFTKNNPELI